MRRTCSIALSSCLFLSFAGAPVARATSPDPAGSPEAPTWGDLEQDGQDSSGPPVTELVPESTWTSVVGQDVQLQLVDGTTAAGRLLQDNGGSVTLVQPDQSVHVVNKTNVTAITSMPAATPADSPPATGEGARIDTTGKSREQIIAEELTRGALAPKYEQAKKSAVFGAAFLVLGTALLVPGALMLGRDKKGLAAGLLAGGSVLTLVGVVVLPMSLGQRSAIRRQAASKYGLALSPAIGRQHAGVRLVARF